MSLLCSVVIPTHNRAQHLNKLLAALATQSVSADRFEVIVVMDGCVDNSPAVLESWRTPNRLPHLIGIFQAQQGQARARNTGATQASGEVIVFLDDDVIPSVDCLEHHLRHHQSGQPLAVLGQARIELSETPTLYQKIVWAWWEDRYHQMLQPGRIVSYRDFCVGNASLRRRDFEAVSGFDARFAGYGGEDFDLGYRLLKIGVQFVFEPRAAAQHLHHTRPTGVLRNMRHEGAHDVLLAEKHSELLRGLRLMQRTQMAEFLLSSRLLSEWMVKLSTPLLWILEGLGFRGSWRKLFGKLRHCCYWLGVGDRLKSWEDYRRFCESAPEVPTIQADLRHGFPDEPLPVNPNGPTFIQLRVRDDSVLGLVLDEPLDVPVNEAVLDRLLTRHLNELRQFLNQPDADTENA